ncbi:hypothetical protein DSO57_1017294 [Entomophthora muscae]|nr:hypothetical protein DSO57_1017294 [Entomophthora muscae]
MAKLPKLVLRQCQPHSKEWIQLLKLVLACALQNVKVQYSILENAEFGALVPSLEFAKERVSLFEPNATSR